MSVFKYQVWDTLSLTYWFTQWDSGVCFCLCDAVTLLDELQKTEVKPGQFEIHRIKIGEMQTIE